MIHLYICRQASESWAIWLICSCFLSIHRYESTRTELKTFVRTLSRWSKALVDWSNYLRAEIREKTFTLMRVFTAVAFHFSSRIRSKDPPIGSGLGRVLREPPPGQPLLLRGQWGVRGLPQRPAASHPLRADQLLSRDQPRWKDCLVVPGRPPILCNN